MEFGSELPQSRWARFKEWIRTHQRATIVIVGVFLIVAASAGAYTYYVLTTPPPPDTTPIAVKPKPKYYAPLTGLLVKSEAATKKPVTAIMIENSPDARPQSGLKDAEIVYEAVAEGGITRFMALYQQKKPQLIGPVRSVRMYYVQWVTPYNASVAHIGGSAKALKLVRSGGYRDIDQFFNDAYYWRATDRYAPHNVYTSFAKLDALNRAKGYKTSNPKTFERTDVEPAEKVTARKVNITISSPLYNSVYTYSKKTNSYLRAQAGQPHTDREKGQIRADVVIALRVNMSLVFEDGYRESIKTTGTGKAVIFQGGKAYRVTWERPNVKSQYSFKDAEGQPFTLARGTTWISAVPNDGGAVSWQ
ncbi:MAG TPA: DUF3048 domain-containing protein [Candidatus Saccharibacteria bacterium]|nr:DUF3048 domain-containing protein [Candidatus Saccharibacteria bacterium]